MEEVCFALGGRRRLEGEPPQWLACAPKCSLLYLFANADDEDPDVAAELEAREPLALRTEAARAAARFISFFFSFFFFSRSLFGGERWKVIFSFSDPAQELVVKG